MLSGLYCLLFLSVASVHILIVYGLSSTTTAFWDQQAIDVKQGDDVTVTCTVTGLKLLDVVRLVHHHQDDDDEDAATKKIVIADNDDLKGTFSRLGRYRVLYHVINGTATLVLQFNGIRGEDSGRIGCHHIMDDVNIAYVDVIVRVPIDDVQILALTSYEGEDVVDDGSDVILQQHDQLGVACVTSVKGTSAAPRVSIAVAGHDVTNVFRRTVEKNRVMLESGLTVYHVTVRLSLVTSQPDPEVNGKIMTCTAHSQPAFDDVTRSVGIVVYFAPIIRCSSYNLSAALTDTVALTCNVKANPGIRVTWSTSADGIKDIHRELTIDVDNKAINSDESQVSLTIKRVKDVHYGVYTLRTDNFIGSNVATIHLNKRSSSHQTRPAPVVRGVDLQQQQQQYDVSVVAGENHLWAPMATSGGSGQGHDFRIISCGLVSVVVVSLLYLTSFSSIY